GIVKEILRRHVFMFLNQQEMDVSFRVVYEGRSFMLYASTGHMKCFECGKLVCPHKAQASEVAAGQGNVRAAGQGNEWATGQGNVGAAGQGIEEAVGQGGVFE
ncbi:uncharacterized protein LOC108179569, partial [Tachysurus ichikawai]